MDRNTFVKEITAKAESESLTVLCLNVSHNHRVPQGLWATLVLEDKPTEEGYVGLICCHAYVSEFTKEYIKEHGDKEEVEFGHEAYYAQEDFDSLTKIVHEHKVD